MAGKLPVGIQDFVGLRQDGFVYVDKTAYIYRLAESGKQFFLSRPRRFGKSLFLSSLRAYWEGRKDSFQGLAIEAMESRKESPWQPHPVIYFDFNGANYREENALESILAYHLRQWERLYEIEPGENGLGERFQEVVKTAHKNSGRRVVVLVDEYDKPLLESMEDKELLEKNKAIFKGFFSVLKGCDEHIRFVFITGVTKFSKVSIFSDLNQLNDISLSRDYANICGITEEELLACFRPDIEAMAKIQQMTFDECLAELQEKYDGYHFHPQGAGVYNPFSLLKALYDKDFGSYWFSTGTPVFLVNKLKFLHYDSSKLGNGQAFVKDTLLMDYRVDDPNPLPLLYQTGYLTIRSFDRRKSGYTLCFPNQEVRYGFLDSLLPAYVPKMSNLAGTDIFSLDEAAEQGDLEGMRDILAAIFAGISYTDERSPFEHYFQTVIYLVFTLLGRFLQCELHTSRGRIDCVMETEKYIYLFEFKRDVAAEAALRQIEEKGYAERFAADKRTLYKIGVAFDSEKRELSDWKVGLVG